VFLNVMLNEGGLPLPALPAIVRAGALFAQYPNVCAAEGIIPGAVAAHLAKINAVTGMYSGHQETIVYCAAPTRLRLPWPQNICGAQASREYGPFWVE
jgi:hypothetical protein